LVVSDTGLVISNCTTKQLNQRDEKPLDGESVLQYGPGCLAQLVEQQLDTLQVTGSNPVTSTKQFAGRVRMDAHDFAKVEIPDRYRIPAPNKLPL
jgi:hypothetical protein